jgi:16S rRNA (guanine527-N7)-methyltransferase
VALDADAAYDKLIRLTEMILLWNERLNLISRKDCDARAIYHKHVMPSVALMPLILDGMKDDTTMNDEGYDVIDVGTGGGFPGLPLAMVLPSSARFTLVDSIKKKLVAISEMSSDLDVTNVRVHCGRVEEMDMSVHRGRYDAVLGRSVSALTRFCGWVTNLVSREGGRLIYIIGGELDDVVASRMERDVPIDMLLSRRRNASDKRVLIFSSREVYEIAN